MHERQSPVPTETVGSLQRVVLGRVACNLAGQASKGWADNAEGKGRRLGWAVLRKHAARDDYVGGYWGVVTHHFRVCALLCNKSTIQCMIVLLEGLQSKMDTNVVLAKLRLRTPLRSRLTRSVGTTVRQLLSDRNLRRKLQ